jgi:Glucodextranase, domain B
VRQWHPMTDRRGARATQVRPRPPSTGRPAPPKPRQRTAAPYRPVQHKRIERGPGLPLIVQASLAVAIVALGALVLYGATGQIGKAVGGVGTAISHVFDNLGTTASASPSTAVLAVSPTLAAPDNSYTNEATVDITGTVPLTVIGDSGLSISLYQTLQGQAPTLIQDGIPIPDTAAFTIPAVKLVNGSNVFTARIVGPGGNGPASAPITYVLDTAKPKVTITAPKNGAKVNGTSVSVTGKTQANSAILAQNSTTHTSSTATADKNGVFSVAVAIVPGANTITVTATDPANNVAAANLSVTRGSGKLTMDLKSSRNSFSAKKGATLTLTATLTDPNGKPIAGQPVTFIVALAGMPADIQIKQTNSAGVATLTEKVLPGAASTGVGKSGTVTASADTKSGHIQQTISISTLK